MFNVLFVCTGNSARSILAEGLLNDPRMNRGRFRAFSAGSQPAGVVQPLALEVLRAEGLDTGSFRSKSWDEFAQPGAPQIDFVITVCDRAAAETCPVWPGHPATAHWGVADPAAVRGDDATKRRAYEDAGRILRRRIELLTELPLERLTTMAREQRVRAIGNDR
jgi:arsenate reductase (thioredoxin)